MNFLISSFTAFLFAVLLSGCGSGTAGVIVDEMYSDEDTYPYVDYDLYTVTIDGDTQDFSTIGRIRNYGLEAPEISDTTRLEYQANECAYGDTSFVNDMGFLSRDMAEALLTPYQMYEVDIMGEDIYGRKIGRIWLSDYTTFAIEMIRAGYAVPNLGYVDSQVYIDALNEALSEAKYYRNGLWADYYNFMECMEYLYY